MTVRHPMPNLVAGDHDEALDWVLKHCVAIRRDNGDMDYSLGAVLAAYEAGWVAAQDHGLEVAEVDRLEAKCDAEDFDGGSLNIGLLARASAVKDDV